MPGKDKDKTVRASGVQFRPRRPAGTQPDLSEVVAARRLPGGGPFFRAVSAIPARWVLAKILRNHPRLDETKDVFYFALRRSGTGTRIEFRYRDRWYQVWSPDLP